LADSSPTAPGLRRVLGLRDIVLFFVIAGTNLQWVSTAAASGPGSIAVWGIGFLAMFVPLFYTVVGLSSRYPEEGGLYVWTRRAFGDLPGFLTGWLYWSSNLPYFPGILYFAASSALLIGGERWAGLAHSPLFFLSFSILGLLLATVLNVGGLARGKWLINAGAVARCAATLALIAIGAAVWARVGSATVWEPSVLVPHARFRDLLFWSTIAFAWTGAESASFMGDEIEDSRRTIAKGLLLSAPFTAAIYVLGTVAVLVLMPAGQASGLEAVSEAIRAGSARLGIPGLAAVAAGLIALSTLGSVCAWLASVARIPFVAGLDHFLPESFGRLHPRFGSPHVALWTQSALTVVFVVLSQAGTSVRGAYDVLVSLMVIATFLPFLLLFASAWKLLAAGPSPPGGRAAAILLPAVGFLTTLASIVFAAVPTEGEQNPRLALVKIAGGTVALIAAGFWIYRAGSRRARPSRAAV
jgi:amino acid transporter